MLDFQRMPMWFTVPFLATINPGTIIILGPFLAKFVEKRKSLNVVMLGIIVYIIGLTVLGFSNSSILFVSGIVIFSIGEFITHPGFIAHVSKIAPKDKVAIYMACIFLSTGSGNIVGGIVQGYWYDYFVRTLSMPKVFFAAIMCVGLLTLVAFILYNKWLISKEIRKDPYATVDTGIWTRSTTMIGAVIFIPILLGTAYAGGPNVYYGTDGAGDFTWDIYEEDVLMESQDQYIMEGSNFEFTFELTRPNLLFVNITLIWTDEATDNRHINEPDTFSMTIDPPATVSREEIDAGSSTGGTITESIRFEPGSDPDLNGTGDYVITVSCDYAGEQEPVIPDPLGRRTIQDDGNMVYVTVEYTYYLSQE
jgi:hypothetical protein